MVDPYWQWLRNQQMHYSFLKETISSSHFLRIFMTRQLSWPLPGLFSPTTISQHNVYCLHFLCVWAYCHMIPDDMLTCGVTGSKVKPDMMTEDYIISWFERPAQRLGFISLLLHKVSVSLHYKFTACAHFITAVREWVALHDNTQGNVPV